MKKLLFGILFVVLCAQIVIASPFLVSDPSDLKDGQFEIWSNIKGLPDHLITVSGAMVVSDVNQPDGSIRYDLQDIIPGDYHWYVRYAQNWGFYGQENIESGGKSYSIFVPFDFTKRVPVAAPIKGLKLVP